MPRLSSSNRLKSSGSAEALGLSESGSRNLRTRTERNLGTGGSRPPSRRGQSRRDSRLRQLSDETAEIDTARIQREGRGPTPKTSLAGTGEDQIRLSEEAQRCLAQETRSAARRSDCAEPDDPLTVDTPRERLEADLSDQIDRGGMKRGRAPDWPSPGSISSCRSRASFDVSGNIRNHHQHPQSARRRGFRSPATA